MPPLPDMPKLPKRASFCEIYVPGYGNGLNEVDIEQTESPIEMTSSPIFPATEEKPGDHALKLPGSNSVSRESSNASSSSTRSTGSTQSTEDVPTPVETSPSHLGLKFAKGDSRMTSSKHGDVDIVDQNAGLDTVYFNTQTWDEMLKG